MPRTHQQQPLSSASSVPTSQPSKNNMIAIGNSRSTNCPDLRQSTELTPLCTDDIASSILSDAQRSAQSELRSTSEILKLAGCVFPGSNSPRKTPRSLGSPTPECVLRDRVDAGRGGISLPSLSINTSLSLSPQPSPPPSPAFDDSIHLPGKFGSLSSAEVKQKLTSSPIERTELLSKLDGLDRVLASSSSGVLSASRSIDASDELDNKAIGSGSALSAAMENAHAHANRIKKNTLAKTSPRRSCIGNSPNFSSSPPGDSTTLSLSSLAIDQSRHTRRRTRKVPHAELMPKWVQRKIAAEAGKGSKDKDPTKHFGHYEIHDSETIVSHEFNRGDWTWTSEWSPDGNYLALATENHGLAIVEAGIWKVVHDGHIGKLKNDSTHSIRSIAWGGTFIALGGTGTAVSIVEPCLSSDSSGNKQYSFDIVDVITKTGFVGTLSWLKNSNILAIGNREDQCLIAEVRRGDDGTVTTNILYNIERSDWVTAVKFSHGGTKLAIGDRSGLLSVYLFIMIRPGEAPALSPLQDIPLEENILSIEWSPDGQFLYTGGEDYSVTVLDTAKYSILHRIGRDRWVTFLAPSHDGSYLAAGGASSQLSLLDVKNKWKPVTSLPVDGGMPLSATFHPKDEYLAVCGQCNEVIVYESSCQRLPKGKCYRSKSSILAVEFSPEGKMIAVGNETGLVTIFDTSSPIFITLYETVIGIGGELTIKWSPNGNYIAIASGSTFVLLDSSYSGKVGLHPQSSASFLVRKVIQGGANFTSVSFSPNSQFLALANDQTQILGLKNDCSCVRVLDQSNAIDQRDAVSSAWSEDGSVFAMFDGRSNLYIYDVHLSTPDKWELLFSITFKATITSLCWGPSAKKGLQYLAFGGENETVAILEIRVHEKIWETVLQIECKSTINDLAWNDQGKLSVGDDDGTVSVVDLSYLRSGNPVREMNYNWQRQGVISQTKLTRNQGRNAITSLCWVPSNAGLSNHSFLAFGGSDGIVEIVDLS